MNYRVMADIKYLDGSLSDLLIPGGFNVTYPTKKLALRTIRFLGRVRDKNDFIRAAVTGNKYQVIGPIQLWPER